MDGDVRVGVGILPVVACLILLGVIWLAWMGVHVIGPIGGFAHRLGVCLGVLCMSTPMMLSFILFALMHGDQ